MSYAPSYPQPGGGYPGAAAHGQNPHPQQPPYLMPPQQPQQQQPYGAPSHSPYPQSQAPPQSGPGMLPSAGEVEGAQYRIDHRDSNSMLALRLQPGYQVKAKPGSMVAMDASVQIKGKLKVSFKKMFTGGEVRFLPIPPLLLSFAFAFLCVRGVRALWGKS